MECQRAVFDFPGAEEGLCYLNSSYVRLRHSQSHPATDCRRATACTSVVLPLVVHALATARA
jgi:hypothetical protein